MAIRYDDEQSRVAIEKKYGFERHSAAGCTVTESLLDSIKRINDSVNIILEKRHGHNWKGKFEDEVKSLFKKEKIAIAILEKSSVFRDFLNNPKKYEGKPDYEIEETDSNVLRLKAYQKIYDKGKIIERQFFVVNVNLKSNKIIVENNTLKESEYYY